jgi:hypothetical protein
LRDIWTVNFQMKSECVSKSISLVAANVALSLLTFGCFSGDGVDNGC